MHRLLLACLLAVACCGLLLGVQALADAAPAAVASEAASCPTRYLLYSTQPGEGFSLRRDVFARIAVSLIDTPTTLVRSDSTTGTTAEPQNNIIGGGAGWTLVLPPMRSRMSPHWRQGAPHAGQDYHQRIPWRTLFDLEHITERTGLHFMEAAALSKLQDPTHHTHRDSTYGVDPPLQVDRILQLCTFNFSATFQAQRQAAFDAGVQAHPGSFYPRDQTFREFACPAPGEIPPLEEGYCNAHMRYADNGAHFIEYGLVGIADGKGGAIPLPPHSTDSEILRCAYSSLSPHTAGEFLIEYYKPLSDGRPRCTLMLNNAQSIFWSGRPHPAHDSTGWMTRASESRDRFLRAARPAKLLRDLAVEFIRRKLNARPARDLEAVSALDVQDPKPMDQQHASSDLPHYLAFHVRRGDFLQAHPELVPSIDFLAEQIRAKYKREKARGTSISPTVFISSDMSREEWSALHRALAKLNQHEEAPLEMRITRLDIARWLATLAMEPDPEMPLLLPSVQEYLTAMTSKSKSKSRLPLTPFHVLLVDQLICELSMPVDGFVGTHTSYVTEMIWQQRRAWHLEDLTRMSAATLEGRSKTQAGNAGANKDEL